MAGRDSRKIIAVADTAVLAKAAAELLLARIAENSGRIAICLTGGSSPKQLYELLATEAYRGKIPWDRVHWFIGDERFVPVSDIRNNMATARGIFLDRFAPASHIHPIPTDTANPDEAAARYEHELKSFYGAGALDPVRPLFDVVLMGVGPDGHTASLVPGDPVVDITDTDVAITGPYQGRRRMTLTFPIINRSRRVLWLVTGAAKAGMLVRLRDGDPSIPASHVRRDPALVLADRAAAARLGNEKTLEAQK